MKTIKTAVSLPAEIYLKAEKLRKKMGKSRSEMIAVALAQMIKKIEIREKEAQDDAAYKKNPHTRAEIDAAVRASTQALEQLDREEGDVDWRQYFPTL
jgi:metal-responsive CopG/Arc/MetJ family transcriptional regulator